MERLSIYQTTTEEKNKIETKFRKHTDELKLFAKPGYAPKNINLD